MKTKTKSPTKGFTLLEVLISTVILAGSLVIIYNSWGGNLLRFRKAKLQTTMAYLLENQIIHIESLYQGKPLEDIPSTQSGDFGEEYPGYVWDMVSLTPDLSRLDLLSLQGEDSDGQTSDLQSIIQGSIKDGLERDLKEVKVSVSYTLGKKKLSYSVTTLFITPKPQPLSVEGL